MNRRFGGRLRDRRALIVVAVAALALVAAVAAAVVRGESEAYKTGRDVGVALFKSGTPVNKCGDVRQGARLPDLDSVDEQRDFYEGCLAGWEGAADDR